MNTITVTVTGPKGAYTQALADLILQSIRSMGFQSGLTQQASPAPGAVPTLTKIVQDTIVRVESRDQAPTEILTPAAVEAVANNPLEAVPPEKEQS